MGVAQIYALEGPTNIMYFILLYIFVQNGIKYVYILYSVVLERMNSHFSNNNKPQHEEVNNNIHNNNNNPEDSDNDTSEEIDELEEPSPVSSLPPENSYIGVVVSARDKSPLVFSTQELKSDPPNRDDILPMHTDFAGSELLLDESTADMVNSTYLMEANNHNDVGGFNNYDADSWFTSLDVPDPDDLFSDDDGSSSNSNNSAETMDTTTSSSETPVAAAVATAASTSSCNYNSEKVQVKQEITEPQDVNVKCEIVENSDSDSINPNNTRLLDDKDDKENARLLLPTKSEGVATSEAPSKSENGDEILNNISILKADVCTIINSSSEESSRDSTVNVNSSCVLSSGSSEHGEVGSLLKQQPEGFVKAKAIIDSSKTRTNPGGNNGQTLAMKSYSFPIQTPASLVRGRPSNGVVKRIGNGGKTKPVVVEDMSCNV